MTAAIVDLQAYLGAARALQQPPRLPSLATMVRMLQCPRVWLRLDPVQRLIVKRAERVAADEGADPSTAITLMRPLGAMIHAHYYADRLSFAVTSPIDESLAARGQD